MTHSLTGILIALALQAQPANQQAQQPPRATIEGMVVRAGTNEPVGRTQITVTRVTPPAAPAGVPGQPGAVPPPAAPLNSGPGPAAGNTGTAAMAPVTTESDGRFLIKDLPPGSYRLTAARNGYSKQEYGQRSSRGPGTAITVQAGQNMKDIVFSFDAGGNGERARDRCDG